MLAKRFPVVVVKLGADGALVATDGSTVVHRPPHRSRWSTPPAPATPSRPAPPGLAYRRRPPPSTPATPSAHWSSPARAPAPSRGAAPPARRPRLRQPPWPTRLSDHAERVVAERATRARPSRTSSVRAGKMPPMAKSKTPPPPDDFVERIVDIDVAAEMQGSFLEYAYSRHLLAARSPTPATASSRCTAGSSTRCPRWACAPTAPHVKSARVVGDVMGKLHPHGDGAIYDALVRMAQPFSMRVPLVDGHGNFGSLGTTTRRRRCATPSAGLDAGRDADDRRPRRGRRRLPPELRRPRAPSPTVLPAAFPNLLVNGATGIAVGMATNMAPHNLVEVVAAARHLLAHPKATLDDLMRFVPGPDLPTGGKIVGLDGIREAYETGRGTFRTRATARIENVTPAPARHRRHRAALRRRPREGHREDQRPRAAPRSSAASPTSPTSPTASTGLRLVIEIKNGFHPEAVLEQLYRLTPMEETFGINNVALVDGPAAHARAARAAPGLRRPPARGRPPAQRVPPDARPQERLHLVEGLLRRDPRHRRGHPGHPHLATTPPRRGTG